MSLNPLVIGLTGPFGSGCTTAASIIEDRLGFRRIQLSDVIREEWKQSHPHVEPNRSDLQALGNQIRKDSKDAGILARLSIERLEALCAESRVVMDGIRNLGEIEFLRERFGTGFILFALECAPSDRWLRLQHRYDTEDGGGLESFRRDDERDRDEGDRLGQQVQLCADHADVLINNTDDIGVAALRDKLPDYIDLVTGRKPRYATPSEIFMNLAYSAAHGSKCLKRQVGAVIVNAPPGVMGDIVGQGFNENPAPTRPCVEEPAYGANTSQGLRGRCYRDILRDNALQSFTLEGVRCPACGARLRDESANPDGWKCSSCQQDSEKYFWPERAMTLCTAIHAEVAALFSAGRRSRGATLYTTTLPCFQCTEKIILAGIKYIVFNEPYPDVRAGERFSLAGVEVERFEGVRSRRFDEFFARART